MNIQTIEVTPTLDTSGAFADKELMHGTVMEFDGVTPFSGGSFWLWAVEFIDVSDQGIAMDLWLLTASPTNSTLTANSALALHDTDLNTVIDVIGSGEWKDAANGQVSCVRPRRPYGLPAGTRKIYGLLQSRGAGTYGASGVKIRLTVSDTAG